MSDQLSQDTVGTLFRTVLQHMKCIETRLEFSKCVTSQKQKYALSSAIMKVRTAIDHLCGLLGDSGQVMSIKKELDKADLVYLMIFTEELFKLPTEDLEEVASIIENYVNQKDAANDQQV